MSAAADNVVTAGELSALREMLEHKKPGAEAFVSGHGYRFGQSIIMIGSSAHGWRRGMTVSYGDHAGRAERYVRMFIAAQPKKIARGEPGLESRGGNSQSIYDRSGESKGKISVANIRLS
jgi:hypothetical protein